MQYYYHQLAFGMVVSSVAQDGSQAILTLPPPPPLPPLDSLLF